MRFVWAILCVLLSAATAAAKEPTRPNILHINADDHRADAIAAFGTPVLKTPALDSLVARGMTFSACYTQGSMVGAVCLPSRTMMQTGRSWLRIGGRAAGGGADNPQLVPLATVMADAGYETWHMGKGGNEYTAGLKAFQTNLIDTDKQDGGRAGSSGRHAEAAIKFLKERAHSKPFYIYLAPPVPHDPRVAPPEFHAMYDAAKIPLPPAFMPLHPWDNGEMTVRDEKLAPWPRTPDDTKRQIAEYYACVTCLDHHIGRILAAIKETGQFDNTIVVFTGDNGLSLGEHGLFGKQNLYEFGGMHVPFVVAGPGVPHGKTNAFAYLMDIYPTFCDYGGAKLPGGIEGKSLRPVIEGKQAKVRDVLYTGYRNCQRAVRDDRWKLIRYPLVDRTQLFDLAADPRELSNLAGKPEHAAKLAEMTAILQKEMETYGDSAPLVVPNPGPADWMPPKAGEPVPKSKPAASKRNKR